MDHPIYDVCYWASWIKGGNESLKKLDNELKLLDQKLKKCDKLGKFDLYKYNEYEPIHGLMMKYGKLKSECIDVKKEYDHLSWVKTEITKDNDNAVEKINRICVEYYKSKCESD